MLLREVREAGDGVCDRPPTRFAYRLRSASEVGRAAVLYVDAVSFDLGDVRALTRGLSLSFLGQSSRVDVMIGPSADLFCERGEFNFGTLFVLTTT